MKRKLITGSVLTLMIAGAAFAGHQQLISNPKAADTAPCPVVGPNSTLPDAPVAFGKTTDDINYEHATEIGCTWFDYQHNGTESKQIVVGDDGMIHIAWMKGYQEGASERHVGLRLLHRRRLDRW